MMLTYNDNLRVYGHNKACRWEIFVDGRPCPSGRIAGDIYNVNDNAHRHHNLVGFCDRLSAGKHKMDIRVAQTPGYRGSDCYTGWHDKPHRKGGSWVMDAREIPIRSLVHGTTQHGPADGRDSGFVAKRTLAFTKKNDDTKLRLTYMDNMRVYGNGKACYWEIRVDGKPCPSGVIRGDRHNSGSENPHRFHSIIGYCDKIRKGSRQVSVFVGQVAGGSDCYTGWAGGASWTLAAEEEDKRGKPELPELPTPEAAYMLKHGPQDGKDGGWVNGRTLLFEKKSAKSRLLITYQDNLRVYGHGKACRWTVKLDGADCKTGTITTDMHVQGNHNDHAPHALLGYCDGVPAGKHSLKVFVGQSPGYSGSDCYTGWTSKSSWVLEGREIHPAKDLWFSKEGHGPQDGRDAGVIKGRTFEFTKKQSSSRMMLTYNDNLRVYGHNKACRWEIFVDGRSCPSGRIAGDIYNVNDNAHRHHNLVGFCDKLSAGKHKMDIRVAQTPGYSSSDCYTGWHDRPHRKGASWVMDAREIPINALVYGLTAHGPSDGRDSGFVTKRTVAFKKKSDKSRLRLTYMDNMRVYGNGKACYWEIRIDGKSCPSGVVRGDRHNSGSENPHRFHSIIGYCDKIPKGDHKLSVYVGRIAGGSDCYTGWAGGASWTLAAEEQ
jgi:hypothetical protein